MLPHSDYTRAEQISDSSAQRPHLVILGAGASLAACPQGDAHGRQLPVMVDLLRKLGLGELLAEAGAPYSGHNFEDVYVRIAADAELSDLRLKIENRVARYFGALELPESPTLYDYLVLSLRPKDAIATFNWDPFLLQALRRNAPYAPPPKPRFLHGCAALGSCERHIKQGPLGCFCPDCGAPYIPTKLLYPVTDKDYASDGYISSQWDCIRADLGCAFLLTVFGYSAPRSDVVAVDLMSTAWGSPHERRLEEVEIIDIKPEDELRRTWGRFILSHHYTVSDDYFGSILAKYPRRSVEAYWQQLVEARPAEANLVPRCESLDELRAWFRPLLDAEGGTPTA